MFVEAAQALAARVAREAGPADAARLNRAFLLVLARPPLPAEAERLETFLVGERRQFAADPAAARQLAGEEASDGDVASQAAWVALASVLLNLEETINRE